MRHSKRTKFLTAIIAPTLVFGGIFGLEDLKSRVAERADSNRDRYIDQTEMHQLYRDLELQIRHGEINFPGMSGYQAIRYLNKQ